MDNKVESDFTISFVSHHRKSNCAPDPKFPDGVDLDLRKDKHSLYCEAKIPYPAPECGRWDVHCNVCECRVAVSASGRPDDARSVKIPCKLDEE